MAAKRDSGPGFSRSRSQAVFLAAMAQAAQPLQLKELARGCRMPAAKAHRYLVRLARTNLVAQDDSDGRDGIEPAAIALGLAGLHSVAPRLGFRFRRTAQPE